MEASSQTDSSTPFSGQTAPPPSLTALLRAAQPQKLYDCDDRTGNLAVVVQETRDALSALQKNALPLAASEVESRRVRFLGALLGATDSVAQRAQILGQLGNLRFRKSENAEERKDKLTAVLSDTTGEALDRQAIALQDLWRPEQRTFVDALIHRPTETARLLARQAHVSILAHPLVGLGEEGRQAFIKAGVVSWRADGVVHLAGGIEDYLHTYRGEETDSTGLTPLHLLLLHDEVTDLLRQTSQLDELARQVVADAFISCLSPVALPLAVESFFVEWESRQAPASRVAGPASAEGEDPEEWMDCIIAHDDLRPEAFVERTHAEQREILREMFGDDWNEEDESALEAA
jgi:hypothetical protein